MVEQGFIAHWQQTAARGDEQAEFASHIVRTPKVVISSTLTKTKPIPGGRDNTDIAGDLTATVQQLKHQGDGNILVYGGATAFQSGIVVLNYSRQDGE